MSYSGCLVVLVGLPMSTVIALRPQARVMMCLRRAGGLDVTWQVLLLLLLLLLVMLRAAKPYSVTAADFPRSSCSSVR